MFDWLFSKRKEKSIPAKLFPSPYVNQSIAQKLKENFLPQYVHVETQARASEILAFNPQGSQLKRSDFLIQEVNLDRYLSRIIMGDPEQFLFSELALPIIQRCKGALSQEEALLRLQGFHYLVPTSFYGPLEGWRDYSSNQLPKWQYTMDLLSADRKQSLTFVFRVPTLLGEQELKDYIANHADWSLAKEYIV